MSFTSGNPALWKNLLKWFLVLVSSLRWLYGQAHNMFLQIQLGHNSHCSGLPNSWNYLHKSGDNKVTQYCRTQQICQMWFYFAFEKNSDSLLSNPVNLKSCPKSQSIHQREKNDTAIESLPLIRIPSLCNAFTSGTLSKMIRFWICKDQNDLLQTAQHAESPVGHIWSHFDWQFQSRRDQNPEFAFGVQSKHLFQYNSLKSKNGKLIFLYVVKDLSNIYKICATIFWFRRVIAKKVFWLHARSKFWGLIYSRLKLSIKMGPNMSSKTLCMLSSVQWVIWVFTDPKSDHFWQSCGGKRVTKTRDSDQR